MELAAGRTALSARAFTQAWLCDGAPVVCPTSCEPAALFGSRTHIEQARRADPTSPAVNSFRRTFYLAWREFGRAVHEGERTTSLEPQAPVAHFYLGRAYLFSNQVQRAVEMLERAVALGGEAAIWKGALSYARAHAGDREGASRILLELTERARHNSSLRTVPGHCLCRHWRTRIGARTPGAGVRQRVMRIVMLGDPEFDDLRAEPRYRHLLDRLGLPGTPS